MADLAGVEELLKKGVIKYGSDKSLEIHRLPIGIPLLDELLGGGLPLGHCIQEFGDESTGKTLLAQKAVVSVQQSKYSQCLLMDMERSFDEPWWRQSGVDTERLLVSTPTTAEAAIDVMRGMLQSSKDLGMIIVDSIAAMIPAPEMDPERSSEDNRQPGLQAKVVTFMYHQILPLLDNRVIFLATNQRRESIGLHSELAGLPGGRAARHYSHIILKTRREEWITVPGEAKNRLGFQMEITSMKNKLASTPDGSLIRLPFLFTGQFDMLITLIEDAIKLKIITRKGPYYYWKEKSYIGSNNLRNFFQENSTDKEELEVMVRKNENPAPE